MIPRSGSASPFDRKAETPLAELGEAELLGLLQRAAGYFSLLAEPSRLRIIQTICYAELSVQQVVQQTGMPQPNVSRHLALLHRSGVLSRRRSGTSVFYSVSDPMISELCKLVCLRMAAGLGGQGI